MAEFNISYYEIDDVVKATKKMLEVTGHNKAAYHRFTIPKKSGGVREINAPDDGLKDLQRLRMLQIYKDTKRPKYAHGFERGRGIYTNASIHCGKKHIVNIDIENFFPSCTVEMVSEIPNLAQDLEEWEYGHNGALPQGSPTSPAIANRILASTDSRIMFLLRRFISDDVRYTRYADDITFSSNSRAIFSRAAYQIVQDALDRKGFKINRKKIHKASSGRRLEITGLAINSGKPTVPKKFRRNIRAAVHNAFHHGIGNKKRLMLSGKIGHIALCHPDEAKKLRKKLGKAPVI